MASPDRAPPGAGGGLLADLGLDIAVGEDAALHGAQLLLEPVHPLLDRLAPLRRDRRRARSPAISGQEDENA